MAQKLSTRKRPDREVKRTKVERKLESSVFDQPTMFVLSKLIKKGLITSVDYPVATGKEADVFRATCSDGSFFAIKIFRIETSLFWKMREYMEGDPRFYGISSNKLQIILAWTRKEFRNLQLCRDAMVHVPKPIFADRNVLVMEFLGEKGVPFSTLGQTGSENPEKDLESILLDMKKMYKANFVHSDISEFNIMMTDLGPYIIDVGQGVLLAHPQSRKFLVRDIANILAYFKKCGIEKDEGKVLDYVTGKANLLPE
jgi:RIO kinase 1